MFKSNSILVDLIQVSIVNSWQILMEATKDREEVLQEVEEIVILDLIDGEADTEVKLQVHLISNLVWTQSNPNISIRIPP